VCVCVNNTDTRVDNYGLAVDAVAAVSIKKAHTKMAIRRTNKHTKYTHSYTHTPTHAVIVLENSSIRIYARLQL